MKGTATISGREVDDAMCWLRTSLETAASFENDWDGLGPAAVEPSALEAALELLPRYVPAIPQPHNQTGCEIRGIGERLLPAGPYKY